MRILKQMAIDMANAFTRFNLWKSSGGGSGGSTTLADLTDVALTQQLVKGDILEYDGSKWVNGVAESGALHEYSTEEKVVGKWIDGKPIYEKVIEIGNVSANANPTIRIENLEYIISYRGFCNISNYDRYFPFYQYQYSNYCYINDYKNGNISIINNNGMANLVIIFQYTKTTD